MSRHFGKYQEADAQWKLNPKNPVNPHLNQVTRRNREIAEIFPARSRSTSLASANIKSLRLYRSICRMIPYLLKIHEIQHRVTPEQAKMYMANHFRANAHMTDLTELDFKIDIGYEMLHDAEWHYSNSGYLYKYLVNPKYQVNDLGKDRFEDYRAAKVNRQEPASSFLKQFYKGHKSYQI